MSRPALRIVPRRALAALTLLTAAVAGNHPARALAQPVPGLPPALLSPPESARQPSVVVTARTDHAAISVVDPLILTIDLSITSPGHDAAAPQEPTPTPLTTPGQPLGDFLVVSARRQPPTLDNSALVYRWIVELEPQVAGTARIPAFTVAPSPDSQAAAPSVQPSDPITIQIASVLDADADFDPGQVRPPLDPLPPPASPPRAQWLIPALSALAVAAAGLVGFLSVRPTPARRVQRAFAPIRRTARELARTSLDAPTSASQSIALLLNAAALVVGPPARAATPTEFTALLARTLPTLATADLDAIESLLTWDHRRRFAQDDSAPPSPPDLIAITAALERAALNAAGGPPA